MPISKGGLGFTSSQQNLHIASIGGFALNISKVIKIIQHENDNYWKDEYLECFIDAVIPKKEETNGIDLNIDNISSTSMQKVQKTLTSILHK